MTLIDRLATGLGNTIGFLANSGILFVLFALIWLAFGVALVWSRGSIDALWTWIRDLPWLLEGAVWLLFLPVVLGLWIWQTSWPLILRLVLIVGIAGWTLLVFPRPWKQPPGTASRDVVGGPKAASGAGISRQV
jgi:hypothetical protein